MCAAHALQSHTGSRHLEFKIVSAFKSAKYPNQAVLVNIVAVVLCVIGNLFLVETDKVSKAYTLGGLSEVIISLTGAY